MQISEKSQTAGSIRFLLNGEAVSVSDVAPTATVLNYLREDKSCMGTKEGCAEGDCGACTVVLAEIDDNELSMKSVNACIQFVPTLHGKAIYTVEYLRQKNGDLHPSQQAMVDCHGSQCGFCTPGFIMSLWSVYNEHQPAGTKANNDEVRSALTGNLCRCTGYRPILEAAEKMFELPSVSFDRDGLFNVLKQLSTEENNTKGINIGGASSNSATSLSYEYNNEQFFAPKTLDELLQLKSQHPEATILAGGTDVGLWINKQFRELPTIIYLGDVTELKQCNKTESGLSIGAGATLTKAYEAISELYPDMD